MEEYSPDQMELDARDVVARAIAQELREAAERRTPASTVLHREDEGFKCGSSGRTSGS